MGKHMIRCTTMTAAVLVLAGAITGSSAVIAQAQMGTCSNEQVRRLEQFASELPDCRAYEQVSPVAKNLNDAIGAGGLVQASSSGPAVTFFSLSPFPGVAGSSEFPTYLSSRAGETWSNRALLPPSDGGPEAVIGFTEDLSYTLIATGEPNPAPGGSIVVSGPGGSERREATPEAVNYYVEDDASETYRLLFPGGQGDVVFAAASTEGPLRILFETFSGPAEIPTGVYLWEEGHVTLIAPDAVAGPVGPLKEGRGKDRYIYTQYSLSNDGLRVFFTTYPAGSIFMSEPGAGTMAPVSGGSAEWLTATPDGSYAFYSEGGELYRYSAATGISEQLTGGAAADVQGLAGVSADGSSAYFVATRALPAASVEGRHPVEGADIDNLYLWRAGAGLTFIAELSIHDSADWIDHEQPSGVVDEAQKTSRVTPSVDALLFVSVQQPLPSDPNPSGVYELYLYDAGRERLVCVSCNPDGTAPRSPAELTPASGSAAAGPVEASGQYMTRNLVEIGPDAFRVFFQTSDSLVRRDNNGQVDVYEWEAGHLYLISTGTSTSSSYFGNASPDGTDVYFFTRQSLVSQDSDSNYDLYDARVGGGILGQNPLPPAACEEASTCRALSPPPPVGAPYSASFVGPGDPMPSSSPPSVATLSRAQLLVRALKTCRARSRRDRRRACEAQARRRYAARSSTVVHHRKAR
jgi:hypothetical protein